jgi:hypothetical protein
MTEDDRRFEAWTRYRTSLGELEGRDYEEAEQISWAELQRELAAIDALERQLAGSAAD